LAGKNDSLPPEISSDPPLEAPGSPDGDEERGREPRRQTEAGCTVEGRRGLVHCLTVIGQIEGHTELPSETKTTKYEHVIPQLVAIEESREVRGLLIILNTVGGDIEAGLALAELIAGMRTPTVSLVLGGGHSIGVPLAVSARHSFIVPSATMTIHPVRMNGLVLGVPQTLLYFEQMQERIVRFVAANSRIPADRYRGMMLETGELAMDFGTVLTGEQAVKEGLVDEIGGLAQAMECLYRMIPEKE
jgi:ATP-dependent protease ClpP protease subunit